jgi:predicted amidohydrolase
MMRVALVQMRCEKGAIEQNLAATNRYLAEAQTAGCELACFPEASITGYVDPLLYPEAVVALDGPAMAGFAALTHGRSIIAVGGIIEARPGGKPYITQVVAQRGQIVAFYRKRTIPDEERHLFEPASSPTTFLAAGVTCGLAICADISSEQVFADAAAAGARVIFECAAPGLYGAQETRDWRMGFEWWRGECHTYLVRYAKEYGVAIAVATQAGRTRDEDFPGGGYLFGPDGACLSATDNWHEGMDIVEVPIA